MSDEHSLVALEDTPRGLDAYEAKYMAEHGGALLHTKARTNWQATALTSTTALFVVIWCAAHANPLLGLGLGAAMALLGLFFAVLRVKVTTEHVDIHYGLVGPQIPLASIQSVEAVTHGYNSLARWGISPVGWGEWLYAVAGDEGRAVKITWTNAHGKRRVHYIGTPEPEALARAIESARGPTPALRAPTNP